MRAKEFILEVADYAMIGQPKVDDFGEPLGVTVQTHHKVGRKTYTLLSNKDFEEDLGPLMQLQPGKGFRQIKRPPPRSGVYSTSIFDRQSTGDMVAVVDTVNGKVSMGANHGNPDYHLDPKIAVALYKVHFPVAKQWLDSQQYPEWARTGYEDYNDIDQ